MIDRLRRSLSLKETLALPVPVTRGVSIAVSVALLALACLLAPPARAATITVTTTATGVHDDGQCSLTEAIDNANADANDGSDHSGPITGVVYPSHTDCAAGSGADTIVLAPGATYTYTAPNEAGETGAASYRFWWYGPNALPAIASTITIEGNGATIIRSGSTPFRFFFVGADPNSAVTDGYTSPGAGHLTLENLTLENGLAKGGDSGGFSGGGGGGAGLGGAIFSQGEVTLDRVTLASNTAQGGSANKGGGSGGGGMGENATGPNAGGGFGGGFSGIGAVGGAGNATGTGGGGAGFGVSENGGAATSSGGNGGGAATGLAGDGFPQVGGYGGDGGGGGGSGDSSTGSGFGAPNTSGSSTAGGGVGTGGGASAGGGFGGGGGAGGAGGGFGAGGGGGDNNGIGGFGGGRGGDGDEIGGGGGGMGGAIFNMQGTLTLTNSTLASNTAAGGITSYTATKGAGYGGAIFNLSGTVDVSFSTIAFNTADNGGAIYNLVYDSVTARTAAVTLTDSILADSTATKDLVSNKPTNTVAGTNLGTAKVTSVGSSFVMTATTQGGADPLPGFDTSDPLLDPTLAANGFAHVPDTLALQTGSPAIDAATSGACPTTDERGVPRPQGSYCDVGAYEVDTTPPTVTGTSLQSTYTNAGLASFTVTFSEPVADTGSGGADSVTNPANYLLVEAGGNKTFDTQSCSGGVMTDDSQIPAAGVTYDSGSMTATVTLGSPLPIGTYRLFVCGTTSITDLAGLPLNGGTDSTFDFTVVAVTAIPALSFTGLALLALLLAGAGLALRRRL